MRQVGAWPASPLTMLSEYLDALRQLLAGERLTLRGRYVTLSDVRLDDPPSVPPPVLAGVRGPKSLTVAGRHAEGTILAEPVTPEYLRAARAQLAAPPGHHIVGYNVAAVDDDPAQARMRVRSALAFAGDPAWAPHTAPLSFAHELKELAARARSTEELTRLLPDAWVDQLAVVGTPAHIRHRLEALHAAGANQLVLNPVGADPLTALESFGGLVREN